MSIEQSRARIEQQDPTEADNFRATVLVAVEAAAGQPGPVVAEMTRKVTSALHTA